MAGAVHNQRGAATFQLADLTLPLPILTLLFNEYCQKRFFPIFKAYPAEVWWFTIPANLFDSVC